MSTEGNVAIVTGAAQGIGRAIATGLLSQGYKVKYIVTKMIFSSYKYFFMPSCTYVMWYATISA